MVVSTFKQIDKIRRHLMEVQTDALKSKQAYELNRAKNEIERLWMKEYAKNGSWKDLV